MIRRTAAVLVASAGMACATSSGPGDPAAITDASAEIDAPAADTWLEPDASQGGVCVQGDEVIDVGPHDDHDGDGWSIADGDCNDCDANANPGAYDVPDNGVDEDCSGTADDESSDCDGSLQVPSNDPVEAAKALGLCRVAQQAPTQLRYRTWGVVSAQYVMADGSAGMHFASHGILPNFGPYVAPQQGHALLALSTAAARRPGDIAYRSPLEGDMKTSSPTPVGWPKEFPSCPGVPAAQPIANDPAALRMVIRVPSNARAVSFRFNFYTTEFPRFVCNQYNDFFVALLRTGASNPGAQDGNISFDGEGNPISVNSAFIDVCTPQVAAGRPFLCALGNAPLMGTGFGASEQEPRGHGATGWLETTAAVLPGEDIELMFAIWDAGDHLWGSTVLLDAVQFHAEGASEPVTMPVVK